METLGETFQPGKIQKDMKDLVMLKIFLNRNKQKTSI